MAIKVGDRLPKATFKIMGGEGPETFELSALTQGKLTVLFSLPGAFTPTCHLNHLPGYLENAHTLKQLGIDEIAVISVNDAWVMDHWSKETNGKGKIHFLADGSAQYTKSIGLDVDLSAAGMGVRSKRYSMLVRDGVVLTLNIEDRPGEVISSGVSVIMEQLKGLNA